MLNEMFFSLLYLRHCEVQLQLIQRNYC